VDLELHLRLNLLKSVYSQTFDLDDDRMLAGPRITLNEDRTMFIWRSTFSSEHSQIHGHRGIRIDRLEECEWAEAGGVVAMLAIWHCGPPIMLKVVLPQLAT
jgi:hypothetical protein